MMYFLKQSKDVQIKASVPAHDATDNVQLCSYKIKRRISKIADF